MSRYLDKNVGLPLLWAKISTLFTRKSELHDIIDQENAYVLTNDGPKLPIQLTVGDNDEYVQISSNTSESLYTYICNTLEISDETFGSITYFNWRPGLSCLSNTSEEWSVSQIPSPLDDSQRCYTQLSSGYACIYLNFLTENSIYTKSAYIHISIVKNLTTQEHSGSFKINGDTYNNDLQDGSLFIYAENSTTEGILPSKLFVAKENVQEATIDSHGLMSSTDKSSINTLLTWKDEIDEAMLTKASTEYVDDSIDAALDIIANGRY